MESGSVSGDSGDRGRSPSSAHVLNARQAAEILAVNPSTISRWARQGRLPYVQVGQRRMYDRATLRRPGPPCRPHRPDRRDEPVWSTGQVAARLGVDGALVRRLASTGELSASISRGGRLRFSPGNVEQFVATLPIDPGETVSVARAATVLGVSPRTVKHWASRGAVELHRNLSGAACMRREDLRRLAEERPPRPMESRDPESLTTRDVAVILGRSEEWVRQQANRGIIASRRSPGGRRRFRAKDLPAGLGPPAS